MDFKIPACLIRALRAPDIESISDQEPREPPLQFKILQGPDVKRVVKSKSRACKGSRAPPLQFRILPRPRCETWGEMQPPGLPGTYSSIQDTARSRCETRGGIEVPCTPGLPGTSSSIPDTSRSRRKTCVKIIFPCLLESMCCY